MTDRRVFMDDDRQRDHLLVLHPQYPGGAQHKDGTDNIGRLFVDHDATDTRNFYNWTSTVGTLQDYDIKVPISVPKDFQDWLDPSLQVIYRTATGGTADNKVDVFVYDTAGVAVTLSGSTTDLSSTSWATTNIEFLGSPTWTPEEHLLIVLRLYARNNFGAHLGNIQLRYREMSP